jgi:hypothetical protein
MQVVPSKHGPGTIGIISGDLLRYVSFVISLLNLQVPNYSNYQWLTGNGFASLRNIVVREALKIVDPGIDWLWFMDDDHVFDRDTLFRLLDRNVDIVQPLVSTRKPPYRPYGYRWNGQDHESFDWSHIPNTGLMEVDAVGCGGMLIRRHVLDAIADPWFEEGHTSPEHLGEDLWFCKKAREAGFKIYVDTDVQIGHMGTVQVWPDLAERETALGQKLDRCIRLDLDHVGMQISPDFGRGVAQEV